MEGQGEAVAIHTRPEERPDWQRALARPDKPRKRVPYVSDPMPQQDWTTKRFTEVR